MERIAKLFANVPLATPLRARLSDPDQLRNHRFYLELPHGLAVLFPEVTEENLNELLVSSYLYFRTLLFLDDLLDGESRAATEQEVEEIFLYFSLYERAVRGLAGLFPGAHPFWQELEACKREYAVANQREKRMTSNRPTWTQAAYEEMAAGKSAVCGALVYALQGLGQASSSRTPAVLSSLRLFHLAVQYEDDVLDFRKDVAKGHYTYVYDQLRERCETLAVDVNGHSADLLNQLLYSTGTATDLLQRAAGYYAQVQAQAAALGIPMLGTYASQHLAENERQCQQIEAQLRAATARAAQQHPLAYQV